MSAHNVITSAKRWVVKVGSSLLTNHGYGLDEAAINDWVTQISQLKARGIEVVLVSSGSIVAGMAALDWSQKPQELTQLQVAAAVGQADLVHLYDRLFSQYKIHTAQILLTHPCLNDRQRYLNARDTLNSMLKLGILPIVNENDTIATDEIRFGDNDKLAALVTNLIEADVLVLLTDQQGVLTEDPRKNPSASLIPEAFTDDSIVQKAASGCTSSVGTGGMASKVQAAKIAARSGAYTFIVNGVEAKVLDRLQQGQPIGTVLAPHCDSLTARKQWLAGRMRISGHLTLDTGAVSALQVSGGSLLPVGATGVEGKFLRGDLVACVDPLGRVIAHGLCNYSSTDAARILGKKTGEIELILGYIQSSELIHRDNLVVI